MKKTQNNQPLLFSRYVIFSVTLFLVILVVGSAAFLFAMRQIIRTNKGRELVKLLEVERIKLETSVDREIALVLNMAKSPLVRNYFENPADTALIRAAGSEINSFRRALSGSVFWINDIDKLFYFDDRLPYKLDPSLSDNYWYRKTLYDTEEYHFNININYNPDLRATNLWVNAPVRNASGKPIGMIGTGVDLTVFVNAVYKDYRGKAHFYFFNASGEITGAADIDLVAAKTGVEERLGGAGRDVLVRAKNLRDGEAQTFAAQGGQVAVISIPKLEWYAVALLHDSLDDYKTSLTLFFFLGMALIAFILVLSNIFIARLLGPLRDTMASLASASKAKTDFLAKMSHEIRTPLNAIIGIAQIQLHREDLVEDMERALDRIYNSGCLLLGIINDILDFSKVETGRLELSPFEYDVSSMINDAVQFNIVRIGSKPIEFSLQVDERLPARLFGDELRLKQVLNNILSNAFKYTDKGRVTLAVSHAFSTDGDVSLVMKVTDTGHGLTQESLQRLFQEYERFDTGSHRHIEGTGLGLSITQRMVSLMDGRIDIESVYGEGSTFTVTVKQKTVDGAGVIGPELAENLRNFKFTNARRNEDLRMKRERMPYGKVLIVDDVEVNLIVAKGLMMLYGLDIDTAGSGTEAIKKIDGGRVYDIIFMDHMMPVMDGIETTQKLRAQGYGGVIVALTANAIVGNDEMFVDKGFDDFVSKPVDIRRLDVVLCKYIRDRHPCEAAEVRAEDERKAAGGAQANTLEPPRRVRAVRLNERMLGAMKRDVQNALAALREAAASGDIKLFTTTVHGMKAAFAAIGDEGVSAEALSLELAGRNNDTDFISVNTDNFIGKLEDFLKR